jgi:hypothetical protein
MFVVRQYIWDKAMIPLESAYYGLGFWSEVAVCIHSEVLSASASLARKLTAGIVNFFWTPTEQKRKVARVCDIKVKNRVTILQVLVACAPRGMKIGAVTVSRAKHQPRATESSPSRVGDLQI